ncbi:MAG: hypothetical protein AAB579_03975 [Patescibacteria group bacterium]
MMNEKGMTRMAKFVGEDTRLGREIAADPSHRYRTWLGVEVEVELDTAKLVPRSGIDRRMDTWVRITLPWGETAMVRSAHITGLGFEAIRFMMQLAFNKHSPTKSRMPAATSTKEGGLAPPA